MSEGVSEGVLEVEQGGGKRQRLTSLAKAHVIRPAVTHWLVKHAAGGSY